MQLIGWYMSASCSMDTTFSLVEIIEDANQQAQQARLQALSDLVAPDKNGGGSASFETTDFGSVEVEDFGSVEVEAGIGYNRNRWCVRSATTDCSWIVGSQGEVGSVTSYTFESLQLRNQEINSIRGRLDEVLIQCLASQHQPVTSPE